MSIAGLAQSPASEFSQPWLMASDWQRGWLVDATGQVCHAFPAFPAMMLQQSPLGIDGNPETHETPEMSLYILLMLAVMVALLCCAVCARPGPSETHEKGTQTDTVPLTMEYTDRLTVRIFFR